MKSYEVQKRLANLGLSLSCLLSEVNSLRDSPNIDEDYKLEWAENKHLTPGFFDELDRLEAALSARWDRRSA